MVQAPLRLVFRVKKSFAAARAQQESGLPAWPAERRSPAVCVHMTGFSDSRHAHKTLAGYQLGVCNSRGDDDA
jgi:hypothetical protein